MSVKALQIASLTLSAVTTGLMAGLFAAFAYAVMPALKGASDRTFIDVMQRINVSILNGWFMSAFLGAVVFLGVAAAVHFRGSGRPAFWWIVAALALYLVMFVVTSAINVPLNNKLAAAGKPGHIADPAAVRADFESTWVAWNVVRAVVCTAALACLAWALILHGRATTSAETHHVPAAPHAVHQALRY